MGRPEKGTLSRRRLIQNGLLVTAGGVGLPALFPELAGADIERPISEAEGRSWTIGNDRITRTVTFQPRQGFFTERFSDLSTQANFIVPAKIRRDMAQEFAFVCNGKPYAGTNSTFELLRASEANLPNGKSLTVQLRHRDTPLEVSVVYTVYDRHPALDAIRHNSS
jgi:hypothetical protein